MQTYDPILVPALIGFVGALAGGVGARFVIRRLEVETREREGAFSALLGLALAHELIGSFPDDVPSERELARLERLRQDSVHLLINAAGKTHKDLRGDLYLLGIMIQRGLGSAMPTETKKSRLRSHMKSLEDRITKSYLGTMFAWKKIGMTLEDAVEAFIEYVRNSMS